MSHRKPNGSVKNVLFKLSYIYYVCTYVRIIYLYIIVSSRIIGFSAMICVMVQNGRRPPLDNVPKVMHVLIMECWSQEPLKRPCFKGNEVAYKQ